ncbi:MAG: PQQ-dependent sugar dehydrogenase [Actinomycetales bacterium]|nr:PQQ-dependent sugar dehydrogenase [Actinomycetales bacterium]
MTMRRPLLLPLISLLAALALTIPSCADAAEPLRVSRAGTVTTGLEAPWGLAFLPDGSALVGERDSGRILRVPASGGRASVVGRVRGVAAAGEGGLLGIALPPGPHPSFLFAYLTTATDNRVVRIGWDGRRLGSQRPILTGIPKSPIHNGGGLLIEGRTLFVSTGDAGVGERAQDPTSLAGKILRLTWAGRPAPGNPFRGSPVYSLGHRNVQGLALDGQGRLWATEFGAKDVDELNLIRPGANYGWPLHEGPANDSAYADPAATWSPTSIASPSGVAILGRTAYVATLRGRTLYRVPLSGETAAKPRAVALGALGRLRTVAVAPDGTLWLMTNNTDGRGDPRPGDDRIIRLRVR